MDENRSERISISLTPGTLARLDTYARAHHWTRSTAAAVLIEEGLGGKAEDDTQEEGDS